MNTTNSVDDYMDRLKSRYPRDNATLDLLYLIEQLREENRALVRSIVSKTVLVTEGERRVFHIDVGDMPAEQAKRYIDRVREEFAAK